MITTDDMIKFSNFLREDMKTTFATKQEINERFDEVNNKFSLLQTSVDGFLKVVMKNEQEISALGHRVDKHADWISNAAPATGVKFVQ